MRTYGKHRPTQFDAAGAFLPDRQEWLVMPLSRTRDSEGDPLTASNWAQAEAMLAEAGEEGEESGWEIHRFGHWGPGWYEIILIRPGSKAETIAADIESRLENYPVLDDEDFSQREWEGMFDSWDNYGADDFRHKLRDEISGASHDILCDCSHDELRELFDACGGEWFHDGGGCNFRMQSINRDAVAKLIRQKRGESCGK